MRLRITFSKSGALRYIGHLDLQTMWERIIRRAGLPLAYTHGFHPGPRIQIASALPLGFIGQAEIVDIWVGIDLRVDPGKDLRVDPGKDQGVDPGVDTQVCPYVELLQTAAPPGLTILSVEQVDEHGPALQTQVVSAEYVVTLLEAVSCSSLQLRVDNLLAAKSLLRERRGKAYDLRPLIESLSAAPFLHSPHFLEKWGETEGGRVRLFMRLAARTGATGRPEEVLDVLGIPFETTHIERTRLILKTGME